MLNVKTTSLPFILPLAVFLKTLFSALYSSSCTLPLSALLSLSFLSTTTFTLMILAQDHWTHRIQAPLTYLQSSHNYPTSVPSQPQRPRSARSSSVVTLARPPLSSSLKITNRSFRYASPCHWNQLPFSLRQPHSGTSSSISYSHIPSPITSYFFDSLLCTSITPSLFHSRLKTYLFHESYPHSFTSSFRTAFTDHCLTVSSELLGYYYFFSYFSFLGRALPFPSAFECTLIYRIVSYRTHLYGRADTWDPLY